jgi:hypothetical protein
MSGSPTHNENGADVPDWLLKTKTNHKFVSGWRDSDIFHGVIMENAQAF